MRILVVGQGGREHALTWALARSPSQPELLIAPGNPGTAGLARSIEIDPLDIDGLVRTARDESVDLVVVGPEAPLAAGLVDALGKAGIKAFGPSRKAARLESSKVFAKTLLRKHAIPTAEFHVFHEAAQARTFMAKAAFPLVLKADGLASGKGVIIARDAAEAEAAVTHLMLDRRFGAAGERIVVEEMLGGEEVSVFAVTDGSTIVTLPEAQDFKRARDGDQGPNTGGMGAYSPTPFLDEALDLTITRSILVPTIHAMKQEGKPYRGLLFAGLMLTRAGPRVLEFNVRFGDPETQAILPRLRGDVARLLLAAAEGGLEQVPIEIDPRPAVSIVLAAAGYPERPRTGDVITGIEEAEAEPDVHVFQAGTLRSGDRLLTAGGRVLTVTALGRDLAEARERAYRGASRIRYEGAWCRTDIARRAVEWKSV